MSRIFERNGTLKIISIIFGIILWLYAVSELNPETTRNVSNIPIDIINEDILAENDMILVYEPADQINLRLRGLTSDIRKVDVKRIKAVVNLGVIEKTGIQTVILDIEGLPREVRLDQVPEIQITVNAIVSKEIPIEVSLEGEVQNGYFLHAPTINPASVVIYGAESLVKNVVQGIVQVSIQDVNRPIEQSLPIILLNAEGQRVETKYISLKQDYAIGSVLIYPEKTVPIQVNIVGKPLEGYEVINVEVTPSQVTVNGEQFVLDNVTKITTSVIDIEGRFRDLNTTALLQYEGLYIDPSQSNQIGLVVRIKEKTIDKSFTVESVDLFNVPVGLTAEYDLKAATIHVSGLYSVINKLDANTVTLAIDLDGFEPGVYELPLTVVNVPENVSVEITPETITVIIQ